MLQASRSLAATPEGHDWRRHLVPPSVTTSLISLSVCGKHDNKRALKKKKITPEKKILWFAGTLVVHSRRYTNWYQTNCTTGNHVYKYFLLLHLNKQKNISCQDCKKHTNKELRHSKPSGLRSRYKDFKQELQNKYLREIWKLRKKKSNIIIKTRSSHRDKAAYA